MLKGVDLFCGCGGLSLGFGNAGASIVGAYDFWPEAVACYQKNFTHSAKVADISDVKTISAEIAALAPDIIIGGPPCQDFSTAGKRKEGARADLTECFAEIVAIARPKWFVMENVDRVQKSRVYARAREIFLQAGYGLTEKILNASDFGVPQNRRRFFCIGLLGGEDGALSEDINLLGNGGKLTVRQYFEKIGYKIDAEHYYRHPRNYSRRGVFSIDEPAPTIRGVNRPVPGGYAGNNGDTDNAKKVRPLTSLERALIQTFPREFKIQGSKTTVEQMLGNAVPVKLAEAVATAVLTYENMSGKEKSRGRKAVEPAICGVRRGTFMRWSVSTNQLTEKTAKDTWSWLSAAKKYAELTDEAKSDDEILFDFGQKVKGEFDKVAVSRMKKSIRLYREFHRRSRFVKNPLLV